uniref:uncharacterized protein n=1 Tax=Centroberyx gerrardi TaxID=166262 RepID=UPI003AAB64C5
MNPLDWEHIQRRQRRDLEPKQWSGVDQNTGNVSRTNSDRDPYCRYTLEEPHTSMGTNEEWEHHSPSSHNLYSQEEYGAFMDPDGEPVEMSEEDQELARKRRQLQEIEEQIMLKRAAIAMKKVEPFLKKNPPSYRTFTEDEGEDFAHGKADTSMNTNEPSIQLREEKEAGFSYSKQSAVCKGATLKDRVNVILQQRRPLGFPAKVHSPSFDLPHTLLQSSKVASKDGLWVEDHPLKLRVKALMRQRLGIPCVSASNGEVPEVKPLPPSQSPTPAVPEENTVIDGFQRFLSVLNKGVDINLLSRIVNDDSEDLPVGGELLNVQPPVLENKPDVPYRSESRGSHSGALQLDHSRSNSGERRTEPPSREGSHRERPSLPDEKRVQRNDRGDRHFGSSSRSKSPPAVEEEKPRVEEQQHKQLQNILKTLGLSLEVEEMSKLADRTQERLYGRKHDDSQRADSRGERESQQSFHRHHRNSSSSTSISGSFSPSPPRRQRSPGRESRDSREPRKMSECGHSRERSRDKETETEIDGERDRKQAQRRRDRDVDRKHSRESSPAHQPYPKEPTYPSSHPAALGALPEFNSSQYSQYTAHHSGAYNGATNSTWTYTHGATPPSPCPSGYRYPQNPSHHFSAATPGMVYPYPPPSDSFSLEDAHLLLNPDLSESEGQNGVQLGPRCLQVVSTKATNNQRCLIQLTTPKSQRKKMSRQRCNERRRLMREVKRDGIRKTETCAKPVASVRVEVPRAPVDADAETQRSEEGKEQGKRQPTEEEIKANLKKKLEAFNQMMKQRVTKPAENSLT